MASGKEYPLALTIKAVDQATGPLRKIAAGISRLTSPASALAGKFQAVGSAIGNVGSEAFALGAKFAGIAVAAGYALFSIVHGAVEAGDKLAEMADRVGVGVDVYASLGFAAAQADVDQEQFNTSMDQFNKRLGEAKAGGGSLLTFLNKVSPALAEQVRGAKGTEAALSLMTDAFAKLDDPAKRAALSAEAFGRGGLQMGNFLHQGSAAIQGYQRRFIELAGSQDGFARGASDLDNVLRESETAFMGLRNAAATALFPAVTKLSAAVTAFVAKNRDGLVTWATAAGAAITGWIDGGGIGRVIDGLREFGALVGRVVEFVGGLKGVLIGVGLFMAGPLIGAVGGLVSSVGSLALALATTPIGWVVLGLMAIAAAAVFLWTKFQVVRDAVGSVFGPLADSVKELWAALGDLWVVIGPQLMPILKLLGAVLGGTVLVAITVVAKQIQFAVTWTRWLVQGFTAAADAVGSMVNKLGFAGDALKALANPLGFIGGKLFDDAPAAPSLGAARAAPALAGKGGDARVMVDFANVPRGVRVTPDKSNTADLDLSVGPAMVAP